MTIEEHISLATLTTFRVGGLARYVVTVIPEEIAEAVAFAESHQLPIFVLGAGSNLLVFDEHIEAVVVRVAPQRVFEYTEHGDDVVCVAGAGDPWDEVVADAVQRGAGGIENLSLIPGTVGAAPVQNIGAYGTELADVLEWVEVFDMCAKKVRRLTAAECQLGYRTSFFKTIEGRQLIVSRVAMRLRTHASPNISYKDLATYFEKKGNTAPTCAEVRDAVVSIRRAKLPDPAVIPNAGSFFKNPVIEKSHADELGTRFPGMPFFPVAGSRSPELVKTSAAWIIDHVCGLRGAIRGTVGTYEHQPLVIINRGGATARDVQNFSQEIISAVQEKTGIVLEPEVEFISPQFISHKYF